MNKQKCYAWMLSFATIMGATSCHDDIGVEGGSAQGRIAPLVELNTEVISSKKSASRAEASEVTVNDLALKITSEDGKYNGSWSSISSFPADTSFPVGNYLVEAMYGSVETEGFECPAFYGSQNIVVHEDETSEVKLTATMANTMVSIAYTDAFKKYMSDWNSIAHSAGGEQQYFDKDETRPCYMRPGAVTIDVTFAKQNGTVATVLAAEFTAEARHHYTITIDVNEGGVGDAVLVVSYDDTLNQDPVEIDLSDDLLNAPAPVITGDGVSDGQIFNLIEGEDLSSIKANIVARGTLARVVLTTVSTDLLAKGWPAEINLLNATSSEQALLKQLGLNVVGLWQNPDRMAVVDFTKVPNYTNEAQFTLKVYDRYSKASDPFSFKINVEPLTFSVTGTEQFNADDADVVATVSYNGTKYNDIKAYYLNERGTYNTATVTSVTATGASNEYKVSFTVPSDMDEVEYYLVIGSKTTDHVKIERNVESVMASIVNENNVFATKATLAGTVRKSSAVNPQLAYRKQGETTWTPIGTVSGKNITAELTGLTPSTTYEVVGYANGAALETIRTFTTEAEAQLPNADMETWTRVAGQTDYWWIDYLGSSTSTQWGTNNLMTTSQGNGSTNMFNHNGTSYCATSGTIYTTDAHNGTYAALIRTVGWGSGNSAVGATAGAICKYIDAGLLHLGSGRTAREDGNTAKAGSLDQTAYAAPISFTSRPSSFSFWYKYTAKNANDHGVAEVIVYAGDQVIASGTKSLTAVDSYTQVSVPLTYAAGAAKATKIYVKFMSTYSTDFLQLSSSYMSYPPSTNLSDGMYLGSQLYIDDLSLNY